MSTPIKDLTNRRFGRLVALRPTGARRYRYIEWLCRCECGRLARAASGELLRGRVVSCGCWQRETAGLRSAKLFLRHGHTVGQRFTPEYSAHHDAKFRAKREGVHFLFESFEEFLAAVGPKPRPHHRYRLERLEPDADFEPDSVAWRLRRKKPRRRRTGRK